MQTLSRLLVGNPLNILAVAVLFAAGHLVMRRRAPARRGRALLHASAAWMGYAAWEWLVVFYSPEANIRVDLLLIWPALLGLSIFCVLKALVGPKTKT